MKTNLTYINCAWVCMQAFFQLCNAITVKYSVVADAQD